MQSIQSGVWPTMITPFTSTNEIDYKAVEKLLHFYHQRGAAGVFAICQSSEMFHLSLQEKKALAQFIIENVPNGMQVVISGHTADDLDEQVYEAEEMASLGALAYVILPNRFATAEQSDDELIENMQVFLSRLPSVPFGMYECPYPYKRLLSPKLLQACVESNRFLFIKDTCCNLDLIEEKLKIIAGTGIKLFNANAATLLGSLKLGAAGYSGVMANFHPDLYDWLCKNHDAEPVQAEKLQTFLGVLSLVEYQYYPINAKYSLSLQDVPIEIISRVQNESEFSVSKRIEIEQLNALSSLVRDTLSKNISI